MTSDLTMETLLDEKGAALTTRVLERLDALPAAGGGAGAEAVRAGLERLRAISSAMETFPPLSKCQILGTRRRDLDSLLSHFAKAEPYSIDTYLPTRATLARTYGLAKFNFFRMISYVISEFLGGAGDLETLNGEARSTARAAASTLIAEDVLRSIACDSGLELDLRRLSARRLTEFWDQRARRSLEDFAPLLHSAWRAKAGVEICYGTLAGVSEMLQMASAGIDPDFVEYFGAAGPNSEEYQAFQEFLFNALYEELCKMRAYMREHEKAALDPALVADLFDVAPERLHRTTMTAEDLFFTFREREQWARMRRLIGLEGPKKTAEEYVMIYVLARQID